MNTRIKLIHTHSCWLRYYASSIRQFSIKNKWPKSFSLIIGDSFLSIDINICHCTFLFATIQKFLYSCLIIYFKRIIIPVILLVE